MKLSNIKPYPKNAKQHSATQIGKIANSIKAFGFNQPIVIDKKNVIIVGHGRYEAAKLLGLEDVPVIQVDLTIDKAKAYRLADNKLNESDWDMDLVMEELGGLTVDLQKLTGFDDLSSDDLDFSDINSTEDRQKQFKEQTITCPECDHSFIIKI